ncbi:MAG: hypothetical protein WCF85_19775 [Rhodospirillaceae bacterium]
MSLATFDKLAYLESLKNAGIPEAHARAHALALDDALRDSVATQADVVRESASIRSELATTKSDIRADLLDVEHRLSNRIADAKTDLLKVIITTVSINSALVIGSMFGLAKLLGH